MKRHSDDSDTKSSLSRKLGVFEKVQVESAVFATQTGTNCEAVASRVAIPQNLSGGTQ